MVHSIEMGWFILDKYYALVESTPVYAAAMLLVLRSVALMDQWLFRSIGGWDVDVFLSIAFAG